MCVITQSKQSGLNFESFCTKHCTKT